MRTSRAYGVTSAAKAILALAVLLAACVPALAQNSTNLRPQPSPPLQTASEINLDLENAREKLDTSSSVSPTGDSRIGPGDLLNISVFEAPEMNATVRVSENGEISLELLGAVHAAGLTPRELESVLQGLLRGKYMKDPHVGVFVQDLQSHPISVVGAVRTPGVFQIRGAKSLIEVLSMAQGLADDAGDEVLVMRGAEYTAPDSNVGPDSVRTESADRLPHEVFANYSGLTPAPTPKNSGIEEINLKKLLESSDSALNVAVHPGDIVKVPRAGIVYVVGEVQKPGGFVLQNNENISVLQALALAQGPTHTSAIGRSRLIRTDPATGKRTEFSMDLGKILSGRAPDTTLQPKDIVFVPNSAAKNVFYRGSVAALQTAAGIAIYRW